MSDEQAAAVHREPADLTVEVGAAGLKRIVSERASRGLALVASLVIGVGVIGGFDFRRGDLVDVAIVVVEVRVLRSDGGRSGLAILILAVDLVVVSVAGALLGEVRAFLFGERELGGREDETGFANLLDQRSPGVLDAAMRLRKAGPPSCMLMKISPSRPSAYSPVLR